MTQHGPTLHKCPMTSAGAGELDECLAKNIRNRHIDRIVLVATSGAEHRNKFASDKVLWLDMEKRSRPTFRNFDPNTTSHEDLNILANGDIFFDDSLAKLRDFDLPGVFVALTRWEHKNERHVVDENERGLARQLGLSAVDEAVFRRSLTMGRWWCDTHLTWELRRAGFRVGNPY